MSESLFSFPADRDEYSRRYWCIREAALHWSMTYTAARNAIIRHPGTADRVLIITPRGGAWRWAVPVGTPRPTTLSGRGNPRLSDSEFQRYAVCCRWDAARRQRMFRPVVRDGVAYGVYKHGQHVPIHQPARTATPPAAAPHEFVRTPPSQRRSE